MKDIHMYDKILRWEFVDMAELQPVGVSDKLSLKPDPHRFVILPGLEDVVHSAHGHSFVILR